MFDYSDPDTGIDNQSSRSMLNLFITESLKKISSEETETSDNNCILYNL